MVEEKKQPTKEEIEAKKKADRDSAKKSIDPKGNLWNYALPKLVTQGRFGEISELAEEKYLESISKAPDQDTYSKIFLPQLQNESGAITSPYIQNTSAAILQQSFARVMVQDALEYVGSKKPSKKEYSDKYVFELGEKERNAIIGMCMDYTIRNKASELISGSTNSITSGLEKILTEPETEKKK